MSAEKSPPQSDRPDHDPPKQAAPDHDGASLRSQRGIGERFDCDAAYDSAELSLQLAQYELARPFVAGKRVLEIGCGDGYAAALIAGPWQAKSVVAVDKNQYAIENARQHYAVENLEFRQLDAACVGELDGKFDTIVCCDTIQQVVEPKMFLQQLQTIAHDDTAIIITVPNDQYRFGAGHSLNGFNQHAFTWLQFRALAESVLGDAEWFFGEPANGVIIDSIANLTKSGTDYRSEIGSQRELECSMIRPSVDARANGSESLFFAGVWTPASNDLSQLSAAAIYPSRADYRMPATSFASPSARKGIRPRLALIVDTPGWAFDNIAGHIRKNLSDRFDFTTFYRSEYEGNGDDLFYELYYEHEFDHIHYFWREQIFNFLRNPQRIHKMLLARDLDFEDFAARFSRSVISTTIYDHLHSAPEDLRERLKSIGLIDAYSVASPWLARIYGTGFPFPPASMTEDGVDLEQFQPKNLERFRDTDRPLVVGWAGNSKWGETHADDPKGYHSIILPALETLRKQGLNIEGNFADRNLKWRPREEMPQYYSEIDVLLCASLHEGTPNPVLEAMACGVPVLTTDVGIVRMAVGEKQSQFVMEERSADCMIPLLKQLYERRELLADLSSENLDRIRTWQWRMKMPKWMELFGAAQQRHQQQRAFKYTCMLHILETMSIVKKVKDINARLRKTNENLHAQLKGKG